jgi:2-phosphosulfolactate phosphatase
VVRGKTVIMTTTNGTEALLATGLATGVYIAAGVNLTAAVTRAREVLAETDDLLVLCAGREGEFGLDDAYTAGRLLRGAFEGRRPKHGVNDAGLVCLDLARRYCDSHPGTLALITPDDGSNRPLVVGRYLGASVDA